MLKAENLTLYVNDNGSRKCLLNDISFHVDDGEMLVITGPNGGGKSTLAKTLIGIEKADSGKSTEDRGKKHRYGVGREEITFIKEEYTMPKIKTNRAAAKRFKATGTGKLKRNKAYRRHILTKKTTKNKRNLRKAAMMDQTNIKNMKKILPYI